MAPPHVPQRAERVHSKLAEEYIDKNKQQKKQERAEAAATRRIAQAALTLLEDASVDSQSQLTVSVYQPQGGRNSITSNTSNAPNTSVKSPARSYAKPTNRKQIGISARPPAGSRTQLKSVALQSPDKRYSSSVDFDPSIPLPTLILTDCAHLPLTTRGRPLIVPYFKGPHVLRLPLRGNSTLPYISPYSQPGPSGSTSSFPPSRSEQAGSRPLGFAQTNIRGPPVVSGDTFRGQTAQSQRFNTSTPYISPYSQPGPSGSISSFPPSQLNQAGSRPLGLAQTDNQGPPLASWTDKEKPGKNDNMVGKKPPKTLRQEGLERTNNGFGQSSWPETQMINQKNYYTDYMKRDEQILPYRLQGESSRDKMIQNAKDKDRALARTGDTEVPNLTNGEDDAEAEGAETNDDLDGSKTIVIHPGSQNLRIGFANDALPKTVPMCLAYKWSSTESTEYEARPKRQKLNASPDQQFGEEFSKKFAKMSSELKVDMRANKRKVLPNSKELAVNFNKRTEPEKIPEHNDPLRIEWTDISGQGDSVADYFAGMKAQRVPDDSNPSYRVCWPIQNGWYNETSDYMSEEAILDDFEAILESALRDELGLKRRSQWREFNAVFIVPDLYDKKQLGHLLQLAFTEFEFKQVAIIQESLAASFGGGYTRVCVVDIGAQKTSIACVDEGMIIEESRVNLKYGGRDVTETFIKMMLHNYFPYQDINLMRRYDFLLAEELKINYCTMNQVDIVVQLYSFHLRAPNQPTRKYQFKTYDEPLLALMGFFDPSLFDHSDKLKGRRNFIKRSYNAYDPDQPDDPISAAQLQILSSIKPSLASVNGSVMNGNGNADMSTPQKEKPNPFNHISRMDSQINGDSRATSTAGSPAPEGAHTPSLGPPVTVGTSGGSPGPSGIIHFGNGSHNSGTPVPGGVFVDPLARTAEDIAIERDSVLPVAPLDTSIIASITHAAKGDEKKARDLFGGIMVIGGGAKTPGLVTILEEKLKGKRPDLAEKILVGISPREMDGQVVSWKGGSVYARMTTHDSWVGPLEYERLGVRALYHKAIWAL